MKVKLSSFLQLRLNVLLYRKLGWKVCLNYLLFIGGLYYLIKKNERNMISESVKQVFRNQKDEHELKLITKDVFRGTLYHYFEKIFNAYENDEKNKIIRIKIITIYFLIFIIFHPVLFIINNV